MNYDITNLLSTTCYVLAKQAYKAIGNENAKQKQSNHYVRVKVPPCVCTENTVRRGCVVRLIQHEAKPNAVFASRHPQILYFSYTPARRCFKCYIVLLAWSSGSEQFSLVLKPLRLSVIRISVSVHIIYF